MSKIDVWRQKPKTVLAASLLAVSAAMLPLDGRAEQAGWPSYNRTLTSERYSPLDQIDRENVSDLALICSYDTGVKTSFQTGPIVVDNTIYVTTEFDTIALDAATCAEKWRVHEDYEPASPLKVNRGVAHLDGRLFRGTQDGRVLAYDAATGERLWQAQVAKPELGESIPAAPIAWSGLVFIGNAGGDNLGVKGRMYALDAESGEVVWEFYLVPEGAEHAEATHGEGTVPVSGGATWTSYSLDPETGILYVPGGNPAPDFILDARSHDHDMTNSIVALDAQKGEHVRHFNLVIDDFHDWDVSAAPALVRTRSGRELLAAAPKDGHLYVFDRQTGERLYRKAVTTIYNTEKPLTVEGTRFCPGTLGGILWNGPAHGKDDGLIYTGAVDWCTTVRVKDPDRFHSVAPGQPWTGSADEDDVFGIFDPVEKWRGWLYATRAESGETAWRFEAPAPIVSGITPTAGGLVFFGDLAGNIYAFDAATGENLWSHQAAGAVGGGVISYQVQGHQRIAIATGLNSPIWPTSKTNAILLVFGLR